jgi:septum formation protein
VVHHLILASNSPRRVALLTEAGYRFDVIAPDPDAESSPMPGEPPECAVSRLAEEKARFVAEQLARHSGESHSKGGANSLDERIILAADTIVHCDGEILGKPADRADARRMLKQLRGRTHRVLTGVCVRTFPGGAVRSDLDITILKMDWLDDAEIERYLDSDRWTGKAGGFGFQDGNDWVQIVEGSPSNVVGLPLELIQRMLRS